MIMFCLRLVEKFCEQRCVVGLVPEVTNVPPTEAFCRKAATEWQAGNWFWCNFFIMRIISFACWWLMSRSHWMICTMLRSVISQSSELSISRVSTIMRSGCNRFLWRILCASWRKLASFAWVEFVLVYLIGPRPLLWRFGWSCDCTTLEWHCSRIISSKRLEAFFVLSVPCSHAELKFQSLST